MVEPEIIISATKEEWERFSHSISDVLCWLNGFKAAQPEDKQIHLYGTEDLQTLNIKIKSEIK